LPLHAALHRVVLNVVRNAIDATAPGGTIECRVGAGGPDQVFIEIRDSGGGIPIAAQEHLFERGFTTKKGRDGHGLGLAICRELLHNHGGAIRISSRPREGTRVLITLPAAAERSGSSV
jgi:signal transduction histidine kinase